MAELTTRQRGALLKRARSALYTGTDLPLELRRTIRYSWMRSRLSSAPLDTLNVPYVGLDGSSQRLVFAAEPVLDRFAQQLKGTQVSLVLADRTARVVGRWAADHAALGRLSGLSIEEGFVLAEEGAGTNGVGTALEELAPVTIFGAEHYAESLQRMVCVGVPIRHPLTRRIEGVLDLACPVEYSTGLLMPIALDLGAQIERELSARAPERERVVFEEFVARSRSTSAALIALSEQYMVTNAAAAELLEARDQALLWEKAVEMLTERAPTTRSVLLADGSSLNARWTPIIVGTTAVGMLIEAARVPAGYVALNTGGNGPATGDWPVASWGPTGRHGDGGFRGRQRRGLQPSPATLQFERELDDVLTHCSGAVVIEGEPGSGRLAAARSIHAATRPDTVLTVRSAALAAGRKADWLAEIHGLLSDSGVTVLITGIEALPDDIVPALGDLVHAEPVVVLMTRASTANPSSPAAGPALGETVLRVPTLRQRREDLPDLVYQTLRRLGCTARVGNRAMTALINYGWPGNLIELEASLRQAVNRAGATDIRLEHLPEQVRPGAGKRMLSRLEALEREAIVDALGEHRGNRVKAAQTLGLSRSTLYRRLREFGLEVNRTVL